MGQPNQFRNSIFEKAKNTNNDLWFMYDSKQFDFLLLSHTISLNILNVKPLLSLARLKVNSLILMALWCNYWPKPACDNVMCHVTLDVSRWRWMMLIWICRCSSNQGFHHRIISSHPLMAPGWLGSNPNRTINSPSASSPLQLLWVGMFVYV